MCKTSVEKTLQLKWSVFTSTLCVKNYDGQPEIEDKNQ